jgi:hypothetical protein
MFSEFSFTGAGGVICCSILSLVQEAIVSMQMAIAAMDIFFIQT